MKFASAAAILLLRQASAITPPKTWDESVTTLEEMFNPLRLQDDFVPTGFIPYGQKARAVKGHEFGLQLPADEKAALLAFLRSL
jgi:hypothetical protein